MKNKRQLRQLEEEVWELRDRVEHIEKMHAVDVKMICLMNREIVKIYGVLGEEKSEDALEQAIRRANEYGSSYHRNGLRYFDCSRLDRKEI